MVSIDRVYQTVQKILNKEQRGYLPPVEFNLFANQAQIEIFENYFYDLDIYMDAPMNDSDFGDAVKNLEEKALIFYATNANLTEDTNTDNVFSDPADLYRLGMVYLNDRVADRVSHKDAAYINLSPLTSPTTRQPVYSRTNRKFVLHFGGGMMTDTDRVRIDYIRNPAEVRWAYTSMGGTPLYDSGNSVDFELHASELHFLIIKICALAGVAVRALDVTQAMTAEEQQYINETKQ